MTDCLLSWFLGGNYGELSGPVWDDVLGALKRAQKHSGNVKVTKLGEAPTAPQFLELRTAKGFSVLMLGEETEDGYDVRSFDNRSAKHETVDILGDLWDMRIVCTDFDLVVRAFQEFYETGDVSRELLN